MLSVLPLVLQVSTVKESATGGWERVGVGWQPLSHAYALSKVQTSPIADMAQALADGTAKLPLRLGFVGHEGSLHTPQAFQILRADTRDIMAQVRRCSDHPTTLSC
jgi:hypothetical protein